MAYPKKSLSWVVLHTLVIVVTVASLLTGLRIAAVSRAEVLRFSALLPQGDMHTVHLLSALTLMGIVLAYLYQYFNTKKASSKKRNFHYWVIQLGYVVVIFLLISGLTLYFASPLVAILNPRDIHYFAALALIIYFCLHAVIMFIQFGWNIFSYSLLPSAGKKLDAKIIAIATIFIVIVALLPHQKISDTSLSVPIISWEEFIEIDGIANEDIWSKAPITTIYTDGGANFIDGSTNVSLQAARTDEVIFFHISWEDPSKSLEHLPLVKQDDNWKVQENGFYKFDEQSYYEDKFAVMLSNNCDSGGSGTAKLGPKPLKDKPANWHGKGYHYSADSKIRDIWHWKAVRTNNMHLADDNFFTEPDIIREGNRRYTAGYKADGKNSGAYVMNWQWYTPNGVTPKRLPVSVSDLDSYQNQASSTKKSLTANKVKPIYDWQRTWVMPWYDAAPYQPSNDNYPAGTVMPSVLKYSNKFEGDRGDVTARATWNDGRWTLELSRFLNTESIHDVVIADGVCLWVSAFDHSQIAHTRHVRPLRLRFEK